jgi:hypothetical protein
MATGLAGRAASERLIDSDVSAAASMPATAALCRAAPALSWSAGASSGRASSITLRAPE